MPQFTEKLIPRIMRCAALPTCSFCTENFGRYKITLADQDGIKHTFSLCSKCLNNHEGAELTVNLDDEKPAAPSQVSGEWKESMEFLSANKHRLKPDSTR